MNVKPSYKKLEYPQLTAEVSFVKHELTISLTGTGESITIPAGAYPELQAILADIGHQPPQPGR